MRTVVSVHSFHTIPPDGRPCTRTAGHEPGLGKFIWDTSSLVRVVACVSGSPSDVPADTLHCRTGKGWGCSVVRSTGNLRRDPRNLFLLFSIALLATKLSLLFLLVPHKGRINIQRGCLLRGGNAFYCAAKFTIYPCGESQGCPAGDFGNRRQSDSSPFLLTRPPPG